MNQLLIHADPGARSGFIASWLTNSLTTLAFDSGHSLRPRFHKIHKLDSGDSIRNHSGVKLRVQPTQESIDLHSLLFLRKNVYVQIPDFTRNEYSLETFTKIAHFSKEIFNWDKELDYHLYDIVLDFKDTFNTNYMISLYKKIVGVNPTQNMIEMLIKTNELNNISIDKNHACSIAKLCLTQEQKLGLKEEHRFWSIINIYNSTPSNQLYDVVLQSIIPENYGILL